MFTLITSRIWWLLVFVASLYICVDLILKTYQKWDNSPVIVSFAQSPTPVWQIPFPAITVCPQTKARQRLFNFTEYYHKIEVDTDRNYTEAELEQFSKIALLCDNHLSTRGNRTTGYDTIDIFAKYSQDFDELFWSCRWAQHNETCHTAFVPILTEEGICYTFNMLDRDDIYKNEVFHNRDFLKHNFDRNGWTLEHGYLDNTNKDTFPRRALSAGAAAGFVILLRGYMEDLDYICRGPVQGFKVLFHHPGEIPRVGTQYFRAPLNQEIIVSVKPDMMTTSEGLRDYDPHRRHCYFGSERELRFYKNYTQQNCELECLTNYTLAICECVAFYMPHNESTKICGTGSTVCMFDAQMDLLAKQVESGISSFERSSLRGSAIQAKEDCDCLPACTSLVFNAEMSQADFDWPAMFQAFRVNETEFPGIFLTRMTIFFKEMQFITSERNELYGLTDFLANCGGLLGLFIGFSFISAVETIYFLTFRLFCNVRRHGRHFWSGDPDLINNSDYGK